MMNKMFISNSDLENILENIDYVDNPLIEVTQEEFELSVRPYEIYELQNIDKLTIEQNNQSIKFKDGDNLILDTNKNIVGYVENESNYRRYFIV